MVVFAEWLNKYGRTTHAARSQDETTHLLDIVCKNFFRQDNLQQSLRAKFHDHALACTNVRVRSIPTPKPNRNELIARVTQLENRLDRLTVGASAHVTVMGVMNTGTLNVDAIPVRNFGNENTSYLQPGVLYLERTETGVRNLLSDLFFNDAHPENHTVRLHRSTRIVEMRVKGAWVASTLLKVSLAMIDRCKEYVLIAFSSDAHKYNDAIMDFVTKAGRYTDKAFDKLLMTDISHKLFLQGLQ